MTVLHEEIDWPHATSAAEVTELQPSETQPSETLPVVARKQSNCWNDTEGYTAQHEYLILVCHLSTYIATQSQGQPCQPHVTTITGGATTSTRGNATPEMPPIFKQKSTVMQSAYSNVCCL